MKNLKIAERRAEISADVQKLREAEELDDEQRQVRFFFKYMYTHTHTHTNTRILYYTICMLINRRLRV